jgi:hypothetical protein
MKLRQFFLNKNLSNWSDSISARLILFCFAVPVSTADENTRLHSTDVP